MAIKSKEDLKNLVKTQAFYGSPEKPEVMSVGIELAKDGYEGSIWLPQKNEYYHKFVAYDEYGMVKSILIYDSDLKNKFNTSLNELGITLKKLSIYQKK